MAEYTLIVMSDSHGDRQVVENIKSHYLGKVDAIFHNGDSELESRDTIWDGISVVRGNCDYDSGFEDSHIIRYPDLIIAQTHGHLFGINFGWDRLDYFAQEADADICLYGHLHRAAAWQNGKTIFINPGSVLQPRGEISEKLYARVKVTDNKTTVDFYRLNHTLFEGLSKEFSR